MRKIDYQYNSQMAYYWDFIISPDLIELRNMASVAEMIIDSALARKCSVGLHYNIDSQPPKSPFDEKDTILRRPDFNRL